MSYNDHGDQIVEISQYAQRDYSFDDEAGVSDGPTRESVSHSEARFLYDYDVRGNWIRKVVETRSGVEQDFSVSTLEQRTLSYY